LTLESQLALGIRRYASNVSPKMKTALSLLFALASFSITEDSRVAQSKELLEAARFTENSKKEQGQLACHKYKETEFITQITGVGLSCAIVSP